jgi:hypothetical protein
VTATDPPPTATKNTNATGNSKPTAARLVQATANPVAATIPRTTTALTTPALSSASSSPTTSLSATNIAAKSTPRTATTTQGGAQLYALAPASTPTPRLISAVVTTIDSFLRNIVTAAKLGASHQHRFGQAGQTHRALRVLGQLFLDLTDGRVENTPPHTTVRVFGIGVGKRLPQLRVGVPVVRLPHGPHRTWRPLDSPLAWTILAWTRCTFFNEPNNAATPAAVNTSVTAVTPIGDCLAGGGSVCVKSVDISSPNTSGAVTVNIVAADRLGGPVTYRVLTPPAPATGTVTTNSTPGVFTYTPTTQARVSAASGGPTTDTFTIAVGPTANPNVFTPITITAGVAPATITLEVKADKTKTDSVVSKGTLKATTDPSGIPVAYRDHSTQIRQGRHRPHRQRDLHLDLHPQHRGRRKGKYR